MLRALLYSMLVAFTILVGFEVYAEDWDGNGVDDAVEIIWAERYKPSFFVHSGNILEPEPVEYLDKNGDGVLSIEDTSAWVVRISDAEILYEGGYCGCECGEDICNGLNDFFNIEAGNTIVFGNDAGVCHPYFDFGLPGEIGGDDWRLTYENGQGGTLPGDSYDPKVYCHIFKEEVDKIQVQYWFYYPYNDAFNNHEGDWEHISVILESDGQTDEAIFHGVMYYAHGFHVEISSRLYWESCYEGGGAGTCFYPYMIDGTHPVVFVGGGSRLGEYGGTTGGSWPCFGDFPLPSFPYIEEERLEPGGAILRYNEIEVEIIPDCLGDNPLPSVAESWLVNNPDKQWMAAKLMWGYPLSDEPFNPPVGHNQAPFPPTHQPTWRQVYPGIHAGGEGITEQICFRQPIVLVSSENIENEKEVIEAGYSIEIGGDVTLVGVGSKVHEFARDIAQSVVVCVDQVVLLENGQYAEFVEWTDGVSVPQKTLTYDPDSLFPGQQVVLDFHARYRVVDSPGIWGPGVNNGAVEVGAVASQGGVFPTDVHKDQCVDRSGNWYMSWCEADGGLHVQKFDSQLNGSWGDGGLEISTPSGGGGIKAIRTIGTDWRDGCVVVWHETVGSGADSDRIYATRISELGTVTSGPLLVYSGQMETPEGEGEDSKHWGVLDASLGSRTESVFIAWREVGGGIRSNLIDMKYSTFDLAWGSSGIELLNGYLECSSIDRVAMTENGHFYTIFTSNDSGQFDVNIQVIQRSGTVTYPSGGWQLISNCQATSAELTSDFGLAVIGGVPNIEASSTEKIYWFNGLFNQVGMLDLGFDWVPGFSKINSGVVMGHLDGAGPVISRVNHQTMSTAWGPFAFSGGEGSGLDEDLGSGTVSIWDNEIISILWDETSRYFSPPKRDYMAQRVDFITGEMIWPTDRMLQEVGNIQKLGGFPVKGTVASWFSDGVLYAKHTHNPYENVVVETSSCNNSTGQFLFACPQGDADPYVVTIDFDDFDIGRDIGAEEISIIVDEVNQPVGGGVQFPTVAEIYADGPATPENGYSTTISIPDLGGWGMIDVPIHLGGVELGLSNLFLKTPDLYPDRIVNLLDVGRFSAAMLADPGLEPEWFDYADYLPYPGPSDGLVNTLDFGVFTTHYFHEDPTKKYLSEDLPDYPGVQIAIEEGASEENKSDDSDLVFEINVTPISDILAMEVLIELPDEWQGQWIWEPSLELPAYSEAVLLPAGSGATIAILVYGVQGTVSTIGTLIVMDYDEGNKSDETLRVRMASLVDSEEDLWAIDVGEDRLPPFRDFLHDPVPNPFNPQTEISFEIKRNGLVDLGVFDLRGRRVATLVDEELGAGYHSVVWTGVDKHGAKVASGVYFYVLRATGFRQTKKMLLVK